MRRDSRRQLDRAIWRFRFAPLWEARWVIVCVLLLASIYVTVFFDHYRRPVHAEEVTLIAQTVAQEETGSRLLWVVERANGERITTEAPFGGYSSPVRGCAPMFARKVSCSRRWWSAALCADAVMGLALSGRLLTGGEHGYGARPFSAV